MGPFTRLIEKIPHRGLRRLAGVALMLVISLGIGVLLERSLNPDTLRGLQTAQSDLYNQVSKLTPLHLVEGYAGDVDAALKGDWTYAPPIPAPEPVIALTNEDRSKAAECTSARLGRAIGNQCAAERAAAGMSASECLTTSSSEACTALLDCMAKPIPPLPQGCDAIGGVSIEDSPLLKALKDGSISLGKPVPASANIHTDSIHPLLIPLAAISHGATRIGADGAWGITFTVLQLVAGLIAFVLITRAMRSGEVGFGDGWMNYILGPVCIVLLGSLIALLLQGIMMGGLFLFGWITGLAAGCACATGVASGAWWTFNKLAEKGIEDAVTKRL